LERSEAQNRALIVDDELVTCQLIERTLTSVGIESLSVTKSTEAPSILSRDCFSIVFLDDQMPFPDGPELARPINSPGFL
jgi:CheY-like chemotaxis protein